MNGGKGCSEKEGNFDLITPFHCDFKQPPENKSAGHARLCYGFGGGARRLSELLGNRAELVWKEPARAMSITSFRIWYGGAF